MASQKTIRVLVDKTPYLKVVGIQLWHVMTFLIHGHTHSVTTKQWQKNLDLVSRSLHSPTYSAWSPNRVWGLRGQSSDSTQTKFRLFLAEVPASFEDPSLSLVLGQEDFTLPHTFRWTPRAWHGPNLVDLSSGICHNSAESGGIRGISQIVLIWVCQSQGDYQ